MPWNETEPMLEREKFVVAVKSGGAHVHGAM